MLKPIAIFTAMGFTYLIIHKLTGFAVFCPVNRFTGLYCPGCGVSRMLEHIAELDFAAAFSSNCVLFCLLPLFLVSFVLHCYKYIRYGKVGFKRFENIICYVIIAVLLVFAVLRNIYPIDILIP